MNESALVVTATDLVEQLREIIRDELARVGPAQTESGWLSVESAARYLDTTPQAVYSMLRDGKLPAHRPNGPKSRPVLIARADLDAWVTTNAA